ncbi:MAG TPA: AAA family ATPase [Bacteroidales bacterium]|nr:AAA family ATPase [Bacteroidales bacterium]
MQEILTKLLSINYWEKDPGFNYGYFRKKYNEELLKFIGNKLIKVIVGQRRSGKSYIVRQLMHALIKNNKISPQNIFYLNKEMFEFETIRNANDLSKIINLYQETYKLKEKIYLFIDEIQNIENWEKVIVSLAQNPIKEYEIFITGSNSKLLSGELATFLSGRYVITEVLPFSYREYLDFRKLENTKNSFIHYIRTSGLPEVYNLNNDEIKLHYFQSLKNTILLKDIMYRYKIRDYVLLEDIFLFLLHNVGNMTSIPSIIKYFKSKNRKADYTTISQYILYMQEAFIIHESPRLAFKTKELLSGERKYYINDLGFRNYLYPDLINDIGAILENVVYLHLKMAGYDTKTGYDSNYEVDFVATKHSEKKYIQVAYLLPNKNTSQREFGALEKIKDNLPKYVVTMDDIVQNSETGIYHEQVWDFIFNLY